MDVPFTGSTMTDTGLAVLFLLSGIWLYFRSGNKLGIVIMVAAGWWSWLLFSRF